MYMNNMVKIIDAIMFSDVKLLSQPTMIIFMKNIETIQKIAIWKSHTAIIVQ